MRTPKVHISRPDELSDSVTLKFNERSIKLLQSKPFNTEINSSGILITFPRVDHRKANIVTDKNRECSMLIVDDFEEDWYELTKVGDDYQINISLD